MQQHPADHCYVVMQDHGPGDGGWGTAVVAGIGPGLGGPMVYTGTDEGAIHALQTITSSIARHTGKPTLLAKFTQREDLLLIEGRKERTE